MEMPAYSQREALDLMEKAHSVGFREALAYVLHAATKGELRETPDAVVRWLQGLLEAWPPDQRAENFDMLMQHLRSARKADMSRLTLAGRMRDLGEMWMARATEILHGGKTSKDPFTLGEGASMQRCADVLLRNLGPK